MLLTFFFFVFNKIVSCRHTFFILRILNFYLLYKNRYVSLYAFLKHFMHFSNTLCISLTLINVIYSFISFIKVLIFFFFSNSFFLNFFLFFIFFFLIVNIYQKTSICF